MSDNPLKRLVRSFSATEMFLWCSSVVLIIASFCIFDRGNVLTLIASLIGVTSIIISAKGNPLGMALMVVFSILYGIISYSFSYYGEMITYLGMTMPMSVYALISWLKNPYKGSRSEVRVRSSISKNEIIFMWLLTAAVTIAFYFILRFLGTANLIPGTLSVTTSFVAVYLSARRHSYFSLAYAANDLILIVLWTMASFSDLKYASVVVCFAAFTANDIYGFINWQRIKKRQEETE